ncbi:MAG: Gfo/Idh/MocA family oxidoreductase [Ruminococcaceae bacterium]|nr:Gfo/Idh/MocA family oxidoreductase [Oscillospiraceae bacterium]
MRFLVVGLGSMGKRRARLLTGLGHTVAGVDSAPARRQEAEAKEIRSYVGLEQALSAGPYAGAFVCTAPLAHAALIDTLLDAGLPVFSELNLVADGYEGLMRKARDKKLVLFMSSTMLYRGEIAYMRDNIAACTNKLNYIYHIGQYLPNWHPWESYKDFFVGNARTGGVREILGIELPWLVSTFGSATPVAVQKDSLTTLEIPYPDSWFITLRHGNGTKGILAVDVVCAKAVRNFEVFGEGFQLFWEGNPNALYRVEPDSGEKQPVNTYAHFEQNPAYSDNIVENAYLDEILNFIGVLEGREAPRWSFEQDLEVIRLMDAIEAL